MNTQTRMVIPRPVQALEADQRAAAAAACPDPAAADPGGRPPPGLVGNDSRIAPTFAMQALADLAEGDEQLRRQLLPPLVALTGTGTPAMRARGRKLLARLQRADR